MWNRNLLARLAAMLSIGLLLACQKISAKTLSPESLNLDRELSQSVITDIVQDKKGFLWVSTMEGLNRFDGYSVLIYDRRNSNLSNDTIYDIAIDRDDNIWLGTVNGLSVLDKETNQFITYHHSPSDPKTIPDNEIFMVVNGGSGIWVTTLNGIAYYSLDDKEFERYPIVNQLDIEEAVDEITALYIDHNSNVWIGNSTGEIGLLDPAAKKFVIEDFSVGSIEGFITQIMHYKDEQYFVLTDTNLYIYNRANGVVEDVNLVDFGMQDDFKEVTKLYRDRQGDLWFGTSNNGTFFYSPSSGKKIQYIHPQDLHARSGRNNISSIYQDRTGNIFLGTKSYISKIDKDAINFEHFYKKNNGDHRLAGNSTFGVLVDSDNKLWVGSEYQGLVVFNIEGDNYTLDPEIYFKSWDGSAVNAILEDKHKNIWVVANDQLVTYNRETKIWAAKELPKLDDATLFTGQFYNDDLWLASSNGLMKIDPDGVIEHYRIEQKPYSEKNYIHVFKFDEKGLLWIGSEAGLYTYNLQEKKFNDAAQLIMNAPQALSQGIYDLHFDPKGRLWVGTHGNGLFLLDFEQQEVLTLNNRNSLINNFIYSILDDQNGFLWFGTGRGLYRLDTERMRLTEFGSEKGQPISDFNLGSKAFDKNGKLYFGGINGLISFKPNTYKEDSTAAVPVLTSVLINNKSPRVGALDTDNSQRSISETKKLVIFPDETSIAIDFSALHFDMPKNNLYRYILEGYDKDWIEADSKSRRAVYAKLDPGTYHFKLLVSNQDGLWNEEPLVVKLLVKPSPYFSRWAIALYILLSAIALGLIGYLVRLRFKERAESQKKIAESEERLKLSLWGSGNELWDWDLETKALHLSNEWDVDFPRDGIRSGYSEENSNIHPNDLSFVKQALNAHINGKTKVFESTYRISDGNGDWIWVLDQGKIVAYDNGKPSRMSGTLKNITEIKNTEQHLDVIVRSFDNTADAIWILDSQLRYISVNQSFEKTTGYSKEDVIGATMSEQAIHGMTDELYDGLMNILTERGSWQGELEAIRSDGTIYPIEINVDAVRDSDGVIANYVGVFSDITYRKKSEQELRRLATTDQLTNLPNRSTFRSRVESVISQSSKSQQHALLFIDLDNFKRINDSLGHGVGDELLISVANILENIVDPQNGMVARLGGDEFTVFLNDVEAWNHPAKIAQAILDHFDKSLQLTNNDILVSPSIGIVMYPENGTNSEELMKNADTAMYYAKKKGKNTFQFYTRQMNEQAMMRLTLESDLRHAIEQEEFVVFYQPKVCLTSGKITSLEALVRWRHEERGIVMPNEFVPLAEESGLIIAISQQVIEKTCMQIRDWRKRGIFSGKVAINLSAIQFYHENLWETVKNALHLAQIDASAIEIEITEGMVMQDLAHSVQQMHTLKDMGVSLALDDFGVGYSSLGNLKDFPIDTLKIDRSFTWGLDESERVKKLVESIITLAHNLDVKVVAEGVETKTQIEMLKEMKCEEIQGFIFSRPLPAWELEKLFSDPDITLESVVKNREATSFDPK